MASNENVYLYYILVINVIVINLVDYCREFQKLIKYKSSEQGYNLQTQNLNYQKNRNSTNRPVLSLSSRVNQKIIPYNKSVIWNWRLM